MSLTKLLLLLGGIAVTAVTTTLVVQQSKPANQLPIPTLDLDIAPSSDSALLGLVIQNDRYIWSTTDTANGIVMKGSPGNEVWHNFTQCVTGGPTLASQISSDSTARFWGYEYVGDEAARQTSGFRGRDLFRGRFFVSQGERNAGSPADRYDYLFRSVLDPTGPTLEQSGVQASKTYYWMLERDLYYRCALGVEYACGNGVREGAEQCDDDNTTDGDGCSSQCLTEGGSSSSSSTTTSAASSSTTSAVSSSTSDASSSATSQTSSAEQSSSAGGTSGDGGGSSASSDASSSAVTSSESSDASASSESSGSSESAASSESSDTSTSSESSDTSQSSDASESSQDSSVSSTVSSETSAGGGSSSEESSVSVASSSSLASASSSETSASGGASSEVSSEVSSAGSSEAQSSAGGSSESSASSSSSLPPAVCGNGLVEITEQCDDGNLADDDGCSSTCNEETNFYCTGEPSVCQYLVPGLPAISLRIDVKNIGDTVNATASQQGIVLMRFDATAGGAQNINVNNLAFEVVDGSAQNITNFELWIDTNGDDVVDTFQESGGFSGSLIRFNGAAMGGTVASGQTRAYEVRADVPPTLTGAPAEARIAFAFNAPDFIEADIVGGSDLEGVQINFSCLHPICEIFLSSIDSPLFTFTYAQSSSSLNPSADCGNGAPNGGEECDDGDSNNNDSCVIDPAQDYMCKLAFCGDGYLWNEDGGSEECDDSNNEDGDGCFSNCILMIPPDTLP